MTTVFQWMDDRDWIGMEDRLGSRVGPDLDDYSFPMDDRLGRRLRPDLDDYCFPMDDRLMGSRFGPDLDEDLDPTPMTTAFRWMKEWATDSARLR